MIQTAYWYLHTDQFRYDHFSADTLAAATGGGQLSGRSTADVIALSARLGWMPSYPTFDRNPLDLADEAQAAGKPAAAYIVDELKAGRLKFACQDPDAPENFPRVLTVTGITASNKVYDQTTAATIDTSGAAPLPPKTPGTASP